MFLNNPKLGLGSMFSLQTIFGSFLLPFVLFVICIYLLVSNMISISRVAFLVYQQHDGCHTWSGNYVSFWSSHVDLGLRGVRSIFSLLSCGFSGVRPIFSLLCCGFSGVRPIFSLLCCVLWIIVCLSSYDYCIVCLFSIYRFYKLALNTYQSINLTTTLLNQVYVKIDIFYSHDA